MFSSKGKLNIAMVFAWPIFNQVGGAEKILCELSNELIKRGHSVSVFSFDACEGEIAYPIDKKVKFYFFGDKKVSFFQKQFFVKIRALSLNSRVRKALRRFYAFDAGASQLRQCDNLAKADVYITYSCDSAYLLVKALKRNVPIISMSHTSPEFDYLNVFGVDLGNYENYKEAVDLLRHKRMERQLDVYRQTVSKVSAIQVLMPEFIPQMQAMYPGVRVVCIPNSVTQFQEPASLENRVIINVARLVPIKRQQLIVLAFNLLKDRFPDWTIEIWGQDKGDKYSQELKRLIYKLDLNNKVKVCGVTSNIEEQLKRSAVFLMTSSVEGFCLGMVEAMAKGVPPIGCKTCSAINSIIRHGKNGLLCDETPEAIAGALATLMSDINLRKRLGSSARNDAKTYAPQRIWNQWEALLMSLTNS